MQKRLRRLAQFKYVSLLFLCGSMGQMGLTQKVSAEEKTAPPETPKPLMVEGKGFVIAELKNGAAAFSNRSYKWQDVPELLEGCQYTKVAGGVRASITVRPGQLSYVYIATASFKGGRMDGWEIADWLRFRYNDKGYTMVYVYRRAVPANAELTIPQEGWTGAMVLAPRLELKTEAPPANG